MIGAQTNSRRHRNRRVIDTRGSYIETEARSVLRRLRQIGDHTRNDDVAPFQLRRQALLQNRIGAKNRPHKSADEENRK